MSGGQFHRLWLDVIPRLRGAPWTRHLRLLEEEQVLSPERLQARQVERLRRLLTHAWKRVPFYRRRFEESGFHPADVRTLDDLAALPVLTRQEVMEAGDSLLDEHAPRRALTRNFTGGSSGTPLVFYQDEDYRQWSRAERVRVRAWMGIRPGDRVAYLWGADRDLPRTAGLRAALGRRLRRECWLNAFEMSEPLMDEFAARLEAWQPDLVVGYASALSLFARYLLSQGRRAGRPRAVQSSAEMLSAEDRRQVEAAFGCAIFDFYGSREANNLASECPAHRGLHVLASNRILEILDGERLCRPGETGAVTVTVLNNFAMPFIRYQNDDLAVASDERCSCGMTLPLIRSVVGRRSDLIVTEDGGFVHGEFFSHLFYGQTWAKQFQLRQAADGSLALLVVPSGSAREPGLSRTVQAIRKAVGDRVALEVRFVDEIRPGPSGKRCFTISEVPAKPPAPAGALRGEG